MNLRNFILVFIFLLYAPMALAGISLDVKYPYNLTQKDLYTIENNSIMPLYINLVNFDNAISQKAEIKVILPKGFSALDNSRWQFKQEGEINIAVAKWNLPANYGQNFDLLYIKPNNIVEGKKEIRISCKIGETITEKKIEFYHKLEAKQLNKQDNILDKKNFNWYIQNITLPVDNFGKIDDKAAMGVVYVRDTALEGFRNRMLGDGVTNWSAVFSHPATFLLLEMRNPQKDIRVLKFQAQLFDKTTGEIVKGLITASKISDEAEDGWAGDNNNNGTTALISLDGTKVQSFVLPLYIDYFSILEGDYNLRVTVSGNGQEKVQEIPLKITKQHNIGVIALIISIICFCIVIFNFYKLSACIKKVGAKGAITISLFAALAFGGITLPTTLLGDFLHVFLGPFAGICTGLLSGVLQYLLIVSLMILFRTPGILALTLFTKYMLSGLILGHFTPLGLLSLSVYIVILESVFWTCNFYKKKNLTNRYMILVAIMLGVGDAIITFINMEQMMFFYRLYYADWYIALYMLVNGVLYSSIGSWLGYKVGSKLQQVMGE